MSGTRECVPESRGGQESVWLWSTGDRLPYCVLRNKAHFFFFLRKMTEREGALVFLRLGGGILPMKDWADPLAKG